MQNNHAVLNPTDHQALVQDLTAEVLRDLAPDEIELLEITATDYFSDPDAVLRGGQRDEQLGFGIDLVMLTPYVLAALGPVIDYVADVVVAKMKEEAKPRLEGLVRRLFRKHKQQDSPPSGESGETLALTADQARHIHTLAQQRARDLGMPAAQSNMLADSLVGALVVAR